MAAKFQTNQIRINVNDVYRLGAMVLLERKFMAVVLGELQLAILHYTECGILCQQCRTFIRYECYMNWYYCIIVCNIYFWMIPSAGNKPYDRNINPVESLPVALAAFGEGWHNYHHVFPWDYKTSEFGDYKFNISTAFIDFFAKLGWARDRKYQSI